DRSPTFSKLVAAIEASNDYVYLEDGKCQPRIRSCLRLLPTPGSRRLLVLIDARESTQLVAAAMAHELQHALEIIAEPDVVDNASLGRLYERIGYANCLPGTPECWETRAALDTAKAVWHETTGNR